jgi:hypothetical protein
VVRFLQLTLSLCRNKGGLNNPGILSDDSCALTPSLVRYVCLIGTAPETRRRKVTRRTEVISGEWAAVIPRHERGFQIRQGRQNLQMSFSNTRCLLDTTCRNINCFRLYPRFDRHGRTNFSIADLYSEYFVLSICRSFNERAREIDRNGATGCSVEIILAVDNDSERAKPRLR